MTGGVPQASMAEVALARPLYLPRPAPDISTCLKNESEDETY